MTRPRLPRVSIGDVVAITFLDHCEDGDGDGAMAFVVYGRVLKNSRVFFMVESWTYEDPDADRSRDSKDSVKSFTIVKSAVSAVDILRPAVK